MEWRVRLMMEWRVRLTMEWRVTIDNEMSIFRNARPIMANQKACLEAKTAHPPLSPEHWRWALAHMP